MKKVLITGATGFLGSSLLNKIKYDYETIALVRDKHFYENIEADHVVKGNITDYNLLSRIISEYEINTIYHFASQAIVRSCANDPMTAYETNVMGMVKLLEAVRNVGKNTVESIVISTSDKAFGHAPVPYTEDSPLMPKFTYETTKACQDLVAQNYFYNYDLPVKIARCSNIYGPGDPNQSRLIPNTINRIANGKAPQIYSTVAEYIREFVYIDDVVDAFTLIDKQAQPGEIYCVGGTDKIQIKDLVQKILYLMESSLEIEYPEKNLLFKEIQEQYIDATKLKDLGWKPETGLMEGLNKTIDFYLDIF